MEKKTYDKIYHLVHKKPRIFGNKRCRTCEILLRSKLGAQGTREYCRSCVENGSAKRDQNKRYYKANKKKILTRVKEYDAKYKDYRRTYYRTWLQEKTNKL